MFISLVSLVRISISSTYLRYIEVFLMLLNILFSRSDIFLYVDVTQVVVKSNLRSMFGLILRGGKGGLLQTLFIMISMVSLTSTLVNKFSKLNWVFVYVGVELILVLILNNIYRIRCHKLIDCFCELINRYRYLRYNWVLMVIRFIYRESSE